jgi:hypothetical protein
VSPQNRFEPEWKREQQAWPVAGSTRSPRGGWSTAGIVLAIVLGILGLAVLGAAVLFVVGLSNWGSNK